MKMRHGRYHDDRMAADHDDQPWDELKLRGAVIVVVALGACAAIIGLQLFGVFSP